MSSSDEQTMSFDQKVMTEPKRQTYFQLVPPQQPDDQGQNQEPHPKPMEEYQPEKGQKKLTDFPLKKEESLLNKLHPQNPQPEKDEQYKVVVRDDPSQKQKSSSERDSFYKNNDIYGVENQINQSDSSPIQSQIQNQDVEFKEPQIPQYADVEIDRPLILLPSGTVSTNAEIVIIEVITVSDDSNKNPQNQFGVNRTFQDSNPTILPTPNTNQHFSGDDHYKKTSQTHTDQRKGANKNNFPADEKKYHTEAKENGKKGVTFFYNKEGDLIYTEECYKEPMSRENLKASVEPAEKLEKMEVDEDYVRPQDKEDQLEGVPEPLKKNSSQPKTIIYRKEDHLNELLDYLGMQEQKQQTEFKPKPQQKFESKQEIEKPKVEEPKDVEIDKFPSNKSSEKKIVRHQRISEMLPSSIADEQIEMQIVPSLVDRPHPIPPSQNDILMIPKHRRETKKKEFIQGNTRSKLRTPLKEEDESISNRSHRQEIPSGSVYHFEIIPDKASHKKNLVQVRRSSRIYSKSKSKFEYEESEKLSKVEQSENQNYSNTMTMRRRDKSDEKSGKQAKLSKRQAGSKSKSKTNAKSKSKPKQEKESDEEEITIEWLKEHLEEIVVHNIYMEQQFFAMTEKDEAICRFLHAIQNAQAAFQLRELETKEEQEEVRENQLMRKEDQKVKKQGQLGKSSKKSRKPTKSKGKNNSVREVSKSKPNIKIQKTVELTVKNKKNQNVAQNNQDFNDSNQGLVVDVDIYGPNQLSIQNSRSNQAASAQAELHVDEKKRIFRENLEKYRVPEELPITVQQVINPDILGLGIYALIKLGRVSEFQFGTRYAITPLCMIKYAKKKDVLMVLEESKKLVPAQYADSIALIALNTTLIGLIEKAKEQMSRKREEGEHNEEKEEERQNN